MKQESVSNFLTRTNPPHLRPEMMLPTLTYHVSYKDVPDGYGGNAEIRVDGREAHNAPAPLKFATIGSNGRCTETGRVHWIGFDFDGSNHATGNDDSAIQELIEQARSIPWLHIIRSRSGRGIHAYVFLAREIFADCNSTVIELGKSLAQRTDDEIPGFRKAMDCCGGIMFYHSPNPGERGYELIQPATAMFTENLEPLFAIHDPKVQVDDLKDLEPDHQQIIEWIKSNPKKDFIQVAATLVKCHTTDIQAVHAALNLKGTFDTVATGNGDSKPNCWMVAIPGGRFVVGQWGSDNEKSWQLDSRGNRFTILNEPPSLKDFAESDRLIFNSRSKTYGMTAEQAKELATLHGIELPNCPDFVTAKQQNGQLVFEAKGKADGWQPISTQKSGYSIPLPENVVDSEQFVRVAYSPHDSGFTPYRRVHGDHWQPTTIADAATRLKCAGLPSAEIDSALTTDTPFQLVNEPFAGEFPGPFKWNLSKTQLAFPIGEPGPYPHFQSILEHVGRAFDDAVRADEWCQANGIRSGADYLMLWVAILLRFPNQRLPGIGLYSPGQNCGKSTFAACIALLMTCAAYCNSERPLTKDFNGQLAGVVLWDFDDKSLADNGLYDRLQSMMTADTYGLEGKNRDELQVANTLHFTHSANRIEKFLIQPGDTRWILGEVPPLEREIPKMELDRQLVKEAPHFLRALFDMPMPEPVGRMFLPVLDTALKYRLMAMRSEEKLTDQQRELLRKIRTLAANGRLADWTTFDQLQQLTGTTIEVQEFKGVWPRIADQLEQLGFQTANRSNQNGRTPASWVVHPQTQENECFTHSAN